MGLGGEQALYLATRGRSFGVFLLDNYATSGTVKEDAVHDK